MTLDVNTPEHDALMEAFEREYLEHPWLEFHRTPRAHRSQDDVYMLIDQDGTTNCLFLAFRAGYELGRKGEVGK